MRFIFKIGKTQVNGTATETPPSKAFKLNRWTVGVTTAVAIMATIATHVFGWGKNDCNILFQLKNVEFNDR